MADMLDTLKKITPGSQIQVKVVKHPTSAAAAKTLVRVLSKDESIKAENKRLRKSRDRHFRAKRRGGRDYNLYVVKQRPVEGAVGETGTVIASSDVLTDLRSVSRFIEVAKV